MRVLVADNEYYARKAILKILAELDVEVAADMETGQEVIDYLERDPQIDAVITDIRMPEVNGLQVAEYVSRVHPEVAVLIVTGYADFNYAQQALRYGVKDYITKPIRRETIKKALDNVSLAQLRKETAHQAYGRETDLEFTMEQLSVKELAQNPDLQRTFMKRSLQYMGTREYRILLLQTDPEASPEQRECIRSWLQLEAGTRECQVFFFQNAQEYVLLAFFQNPETSLYSLKDCAKRILRKLPELGGLQGSAAIGRSHRGVGELYSAYKEAVYAINQRLLKGWGRAFVYETEKNRSSVSFPNEESALEDALKRMDFEDSRKVIKNILNDPRLREQGNSYDLYEQVVHILGVFMRYYDRLSSDQGGDDSVRLLFSQRYDLYNFKHMDELEAYLLSIVQGICCQAKRESDGDDIIRSIIDYIDRSYQYDITLQELAEKKYFMNASYLSRLFKAKCGKTFSKYLIEYRLEKSRALLEKTILKVSDIAAHVGYNDVSHYIQSFRKVYGVTPEQYRNSLEKPEK